MIIEKFIHYCSLYFVCYLFLHHEDKRNKNYYFHLVQFFPLYLLEILLAYRFINLLTYRFLFFFALIREFYQYLAHIGNYNFKKKVTLIWIVKLKKPNRLSRITIDRLFSLKRDILLFFYVYYSLVKNKFSVQNSILYQRESGRLYTIFTRKDQLWHAY